MDNSYLKNMSLPNSRIWMRLRARSIRGVKVNNKIFSPNLACRFCDEGSQEMQEHLPYRNAQAVCMREEV